MKRFKYIVAFAAISVFVISAFARDINVPANADIKSYASTAIKGDRLLLSEGNYKTNDGIGIPAGVSLIGKGSSKTTISATYKYENASSYNLRKAVIYSVKGHQSLGIDPAYNPQAFDSEFSGFSIVGGYAGLVIKNAKNVRVYDINVRDSFFTGVWLWWVENSKVENISVTNSSWASVGWASGGFNVSGLKNVTLSNIRVKELGNGAGYGMKAIGASYKQGLENVVLKDSYFEVEPAGVWANGKAPNIAIEWHNVTVKNCKIINVYANNTLSIVDPTLQDLGGVQMEISGCNLLMNETKSYAIEMTNHNVRIANNYIKGGAGGYIVADWRGNHHGGKKYVKNWKFLNNVVEMRANGWVTSVVQVESGIKNLMIDKNTFHFYGAPVAIFSTGTKPLSNISDNIYIRNNVLYRSGLVQNGGFYPKSDLQVYTQSSIGKAEYSGNVNNGFAGKYENRSILKLKGSKPFPFFESTNKNAGANFKHSGFEEEEEEKEEEVTVTQPKGDTTIIVKDSNGNNVAVNTFPKVEYVDCGNLEEWDYNKSYQKGDEVVYSGIKFAARWGTKRTNPLYYNDLRGQVWKIETGCTDAIEEKKQENQKVYTIEIPAYIDSVMLIIKR